MKRILSAAGVSEPALSECSAICSTCKHWTRPADRAIAAFRTITAFNQEVQQDLLHYQPLATPTASAAVEVLHM
eukprot:5345239-Amphidinium_carterae.1